MSARGLPDAAAIEEVLASGAAGWAPGTRVAAVEDLSPGLGQAAVVRVTASGPDGRPSRWIVKVPGWGNRSLLDSRDAHLDRREALFYGSAIPGLLPRGLAVPPDTAVAAHDGLTWIVMRDMGGTLRRPWSPSAARTAASRTALLHAPAAARPDLLDTPWLERDGHSAYAHHVPAAHENLDALARDPRLAALFTAGQVRDLHTCLDAAQRLRERAASLPATLVHGDLNPRNAGLDEDGGLVLIDWEHVGTGPVGFDLAAFVSLYRAFGGRGTVDEAALLGLYASALGESAGTDLRAPAAQGFALAHLTWGLHLRLGPGLTAVRQGFHGTSAAELAGHLADIRSGCLRALAWAATAGVDKVRH